MALRSCLVLLLLGLWLLVLAGCDKGPPIGADAGESKQARVVSLSPNTTEAMFAVGAEEVLVGRSRHCDYPPAATALPVVGGFADPNLEAILALRPTLVIGAQGPSGPNLASQLQSHGVETFFPRSDSVADVSALLTALGKRFDAREQAGKVVTELNARVARIRAWAAERGNTRALMVFDLSPVYVAGPGSFPSQLLELAGGDNVIDQGGKWPTVSMERLLSLDPDVVIDATMAADGSAEGQRAKRSRLAEGPAWSRLRAVDEGRVQVLSGATALRPGPRIADGLAAVARALHDQEPPQ